MSELPEGWCRLPLQAVVCEGPSNGYSPQSGGDAKGTLSLKLSATTGGRFVLNELTTKRIHEQIPPESKLWLVPGDILIQRANTLEYVGTAALFDGPARQYIYPDLMMRIRVRQDIVAPEYLVRAVNAPEARAALRAKATGTAGNMPKVNGETVRSLLVDVPPLPEQRRIVTRLDALQSRSRSAKEALDAIPPLLERFRQSVLAAAFRGALTAEWRAKNPDVEPASELLKRIRAERRHRWEASELAKMTAVGKIPNDDRWKTRYEEPMELDAQALPRLPESWAWATQEQITDADRGIPYGIVQTGEDTTDGVPTVRCGDLKDFTIGTSLKRVSSAIEREYQRTRLQGGEVLIAIRGTVGATAVVPPSMIGMNISREVAMIPAVPSIFAEFLMFALAADPVRQMLFKSVKGVAQSGINLSDLRALPVPIAPSIEQAAVIKSATDRLAACGRIGLELATARTDLNKLDAATLAKAFRGGLVPQDPADEPASALLARLAEGRDTPAPSPSPSPARRPKRPSPRAKS